MGFLCGPVACALWCFLVRKLLNDICMHTSSHQSTVNHNNIFDVEILVDIDTVLLCWVDQGVKEKRVDWDWDGLADREWESTVTVLVINSYRYNYRSS